MSTISIPYRPPDYLARQGYVKPLWRAVLRRADTKRTYVPADEAYNLPSIGESLESDKYSVAKLGTLSLELARTPELVDFLYGLTDPKKLSLKVVTYHLFHWKPHYPVWYGLLQNLPEGEAAYAADKLRLTFISCPGAWEDGDDVTDGDTGNAYRNKHVTDVLLPAFIEEGRAQAGSGTYRLEEPSVRGNDYFWSGTELPRRNLAIPNAPYDDTYQVKSLCWDSKRKVLYMGVREGQAGSGADPWLLSYNPVSRAWTKLCRFKYAGPRDWRNLVPPTEWEVLHLEYDAATDRVWYVCQTNHPNLCGHQAHFKCYGNINMAAVPRTVDLVKANLFTLHNRGFAIHSEPVFYYNYAAGGDYAFGLAQTIGWGTPKGKKECGVMQIEGRRTTTLYDGIIVIPGRHILPIPTSISGGPPRSGDYCEVYDQYGKRRQDFGEVKNVTLGTNAEYYNVECEKGARYSYRNREGTPGTKVYVYFYDGSRAPKRNVFIGKPQKVVVEFLHADGPLTGLNAPDPVDIVVEHKHYPQGREQFYWPRIINEISEDGEAEVDVTGFVSFSSMRDLSLYKTGEGGTPEHYWAWNPAPFRVTFEGYHASFLLADGFSVRSGLQERDEYGPIAQPGKCRVVKDGVDCEVIGHGKLATYGDIYLFKYGAKIYAAWNDHECDKTFNRFPQCKVAVWVPAKGKFRQMWVNRTGSRWWEQDVESYITSAVRHGTCFYFGRRYYGRNWIDTGVKVFWAAPPQTNMGASLYDGGIVAMAAIKGDKGEVFEAGDVIRFYAVPPDDPGLPGKEYVISEVQTFEREIVQDEITSPWWRWPGGPTKESTEYLAAGEELPYRGQVTLLSVLSIQPYTETSRTYSDQIGHEIRGKYISVAKGRAERHQIMELAK